MPRIVDDLNATGPGKREKEFTQMFVKKFKLETINHGPVQLSFFGVNVVRNDEFTTESNAKDKLEAFLKFRTRCPRRNEFENKMNEIEKSKFASINSTFE